MTPSEREQWARGVCLEACRLELGRPITLEEVQAVQVIARLESTYGDGWSAASNGKGSNNWGAIQKVSSGPYAATDIVSGSFLTIDHHRDGTAYTYPYCSYRTPVDGCRHVVRILERMGALELARATGRLRAVSAQLGRKGYYEGSGKNLSEAQTNHFLACLRNFAAITAACGDNGKGLSNADTETPRKEGGPTYDEGDQGEDVEREEALARSSESPGEYRETDEEAPDEEADDAQGEVVSDLVNPWPDTPTTPDRPAPSLAPAESAPPKVPPMTRQRAATAVAAILAVVSAILAALHCQSCTPGELKAMRAIVTDAAVVGLDVCLLVEEISDPPSPGRRICTDGERLINRINAAQSADQMSRGLGGAGGAHP
jgi:hypothetical protein